MEDLETKLKEKDFEYKNLEEDKKKL